MWFEILPPAIVIMIASSIPHISGYYINYFVLGNMYRRGLSTRDLMMQYLRDGRLTGDPYKVNGLEAIPPDPCECETDNNEASTV